MLGRMDDTKQINKDLEKPASKQSKSHSRLLGGLLAVAVLCIIGLAIALWWCLWHKAPSGPMAGEGNTGTAVAPAGPCYDGANNDLPAGYTWYENAELGYKFAYPSTWGAVTLATTHMGGTSGHYAFGAFASNTNFIFGGNATDYVVSARDGIPTDNPGYLQANNKFYAVQIWKLHEGPGVDTPMEDLHPIEEPTVLKNGCNVKAAVTQYPEFEIIGYAYDQARINLQSNNLYYGVNLVLKNPTAASRADLDKVIRSFQLIP
jgi:hypothetical protein